MPEESQISRESTNRVSDTFNAGNSLVEQTLSRVEAALLDIWRSFLEHTPFIFAGIIILCLVWVVARIFRRLGHRLFERSDMRESLQQVTIRLLTIVIWVFGFLIAATLWFPGMTPASLLGGLGLLSVAVGFAFQDIFENFFAGILILWRFPFEKGDYIQCEDIEGRIEDVTVRMTQIRQTTGELVLVPNSTLFKNPVEILTSEPLRRCTVICGVAYREDVAECVKVIEEAVCSCETVEQESKEVQIFPQSFGSSSIDIEITWWTGSKPVDIRRSRAEVIVAVKSALDKAGIEIPFPYRTMTFADSLRVEHQDAESEVD